MAHRPVPGVGASGIPSDALRLARVKDAHFYAATSIDELYRWFAGEADPTSSTWGDLCRWVADHPEVNHRLDGLPGRKRQPNLFLGAIRFLDGPVVGGPAFTAWVDENWTAIEAVILGRDTQTNEPGRCALLAPVLAALPQPVALFEVGSSAGLCLLPDRYRYRYERDGVARDVSGTRATPDAPVMACVETGTPPGSPDALRIVHREGLDANPLPADHPDDARWLRSLVWPGEDAREARLVAALAVAASDPPPIRRGTLPDDLPGFLAHAERTAAASGATPVLMHSATLAYLGREQREQVEAIVRGSGVRWVSLEGNKAVPSLRGRVPDDGRPHFVLALDGEPVARCGPHGGWVDWL